MDKRGVEKGREERVDTNQKNRVRKVEKRRKQADFCCVREKEREKGVKKNRIIIKDRWQNKNNHWEAGNGG